MNTRVIDLNADMGFFRFNESVVVAGSEGVPAWFVAYEIDETATRTGRAIVTFSEKHPRKCVPIELTKIAHTIKKAVTYKPKPEVVIEENKQLPMTFVVAPSSEDHNGCVYRERFKTKTQP